MRIRHRLKYCAMFGVIITVIGAIGLISWKIEDDTQKARALGEDEFPYEDNCCEAKLFDWPEGEDVYYESTEDSSEEEDDDGGLAPTGAGLLPASYDAREIYTHVRNKSQNSEGLCWLYAMTTALEFYLEKNYQDTVEISPKHFDYQLVKAADAYEDEGVENFYAREEHEFGEGGDLQLSLLGLLNPLSVISDEDFTQIVKKKDNRLSSISRYEDIWKLNNYKDILTRGDGMHDEDDSKNKIYTVKQDYDEINNPDNVEYVVTNTGVIRYNRENDVGRQEVIEKIKNVVLEHGAAFVNATTDSKCSYIDANGNYTFIYRSYDDEIGGVPVKISCDLSKNHEMAVVGWDDEWEYVYEGETRKGAFILQNSWGNWGGSETNKNKWHLSYNSRFPEVQYFESVEKYDDYGKIYGAMDYGETEIVAGKEEYVFAFDSDDKYRKLAGFTFNEYYSGQDFDVYVSPTGLEEDFKKIGNFKPGVGVEKYVFDEKIGVEGKYAVKLEEIDDGIIGGKTMNIMNVLANDAYKIDVYMNDGSTDMNRIDCEVSSSGSCFVQIPSESPVRDGYTFLGYADTASDTVAEYRPGENIELSVDKNIYAVWVKNGDDESVVSDDPGVPDEPVVPDEPMVPDDTEVPDEPVAPEDLVPTKEDEDDLPVPNTAAVVEGSDAPETGKNTRGNENNVGVLMFVGPVIVTIIVGGLYAKRRSGAHRVFEW